jgi:hypothetical protein
MFGWDQRASLKSRDDAMARVAAIADTSFEIYQAVYNMELRRYNSAVKILDSHREMKGLVAYFNELWASTTDRGTVMRYNELDRIAVSITYDNIAITFCERMQVVAAIWCPDATTHTTMCDGLHNRIGRDCMLLSEKNEIVKREPTPSSEDPRQFQIMLVE